ncbi:MAG: DJ-1/PfpI family protein [Bacteroidota bacterium]
MHRLLPLVLILFCLGCQPKEATNPPGETESANSAPIELPTVNPTEELNVGFLVLDSVYNSELMAPYDIFQHTIFHADPGMKVFTVARDTGVLTTFEGLRLLPDYRLEDAPRIDVLVVPSALHNMDSDLEDKRVIDWVRDRGEKARYIMSLCDGAFVLAKAGLLDSLNATTFPGDIDAFEKMFPQIKVHRGPSFVHDGKAITSNGGAKSYDPSMYLVELLYGKKAVAGVGRGMVIDWDLRDVEHWRAK